MLKEAVLFWAASFFSLHPLVGRPFEMHLFNTYLTPIYVKFKKYLFPKI
jgi:hypothetical protein